MRDNSAEILSQSFRQEMVLSSSGMGRDVYFLVLSMQHFLCQPRHCPSSAQRDCSGEAVRACEMPEPCTFPSLDSCQKGFLLNHKEVDLPSP